MGFARAVELVTCAAVLPAVFPVAACQSFYVRDDGDGGSNADGGDGGARWCDQQPVDFCDDFDDLNRAGLRGGWTEVAQQGGSAIALDTAVYLSSPLSLHVEHSPGAGVSAAWLHKT